MNCKTKKVLTSLIPIILSCLFFSSLVTAESDVNISPSNPKPLDTVTFNATIYGVETIEKVVIIVKECGNEPDIGYICYADGFNKTMDPIINNSYNTEIELKHKNAIELKYQLKYRTENGWVSNPANLEMVTVDLDTTSDSDSSDKNDGNSGTPGFETLLLVISIIFISLIIYKRRR